MNRSTLDDIRFKSDYFGSTIGRYASPWFGSYYLVDDESIFTNRNAFRIKKGFFSLGGKQYQLAVNSGNNHNHGGVKGYDKVGYVNCLFQFSFLFFSNI